MSYKHLLEPEMGKTKTHIFIKFINWKTRHYKGELLIFTFINAFLNMILSSVPVS